MAILGFFPSVPTWAPLDMNLAWTLRSAKSSVKGILAPQAFESVTLGSLHSQNTYCASNVPSTVLSYLYRLSSKLLVSSYRFRNGGSESQTGVTQLASGRTRFDPGDASGSVVTMSVIIQFSSVQSLSRVRLFVTPWTTAHQSSLSITNSESTQTHVHRVSDAIQPSHPLSFPSPPALNLSQHQGLFKWVSSSHELAKVLEFQLQHQSFQWTPRTDLL